EWSMGGWCTWSHKGRAGTGEFQRRNGDGKGLLDDREYSWEGWQWFRDLPRAVELLRHCWQGETDRRRWWKSQASFCLESVLENIPGSVGQIAYEVFNKIGACKGICYFVHMRFICKYCRNVSCNAIGRCGFVFFRKNCYRIASSADSRNGCCCVADKRAAGFKPWIL